MAITCTGIFSHLNFSDVLYNFDILGIYHICLSYVSRLDMLCTVLRYFRFSTIFPLLIRIPRHTTLMILQ